MVNKPTKAARVTVKVTPAQADLPAGFISPGNNAPKNGNATMKKRDTATPDILAVKCVNNGDGLEKSELHYSCADQRRFWQKQDKSDRSIRLHWTKHWAAARQAKRVMLDQTCEVSPPNVEQKSVFSDKIGR
ncbi:hypothetical protein [Yoonia algicola]|uniref:Uncharacterized protein n=1 Tax=Yoonia algicola TaxID=3137368 RepID=A0AAN0MA13_9RHOB